MAIWITQSANFYQKRTISRKMARNTDACQNWYRWNVIYLFILFISIENYEIVIESNTIATNSVFFFIFDILQFIPIENLTNNSIQIN